MPKDKLFIGPEPRSIRQPSLKLKDLIETLEFNRSQVDRNLQSVQRLEQDLPRLKKILSKSTCVDETDAVEFFDLWERNDGIIYASIRGDFQRGIYRLPEPLPTYEGPGITEFDINIRHIEKFGEVRGVLKRGGSYISRLTPRRSGDAKLSNFIADALFHFDRESLEGILNVAEEELSTRLLHEEMRDSIDEYLIGLSRWSVSFVVANAGGAPLSIAPKAQLVVNTRNTALNQRYIIIPLELRDSDGNFSPVSVSGGGSIAASFVSPSLISNSSDWKTLYEMYENSSLDCILVVEINPKPTFGDKQTLSSVRKFGQMDPSSEIDFEHIEENF